MLAADVKARKERHKLYLTYHVPTGTRIYSIARRSRNGEVSGAKYFFVKEDRTIENITPEVASVVGCHWDVVSGFLRTRVDRDIVELLGLRLWDDPGAYEFERL